MTAQDRKPAGAATEPPPDIPVWALYLVLIVLQNVIIVFAGGFALSRLDIAADSWALAGLLTAAVGVAFIVTGGVLSLVYGAKTAARKALRKLTESASASIFAMVAFFLVWIVSVRLAESLLFHVTFGGLVNDAGIILAILQGPITYHWIRQCKWTRWRAVAHAARAARDTPPTPVNSS